MAIDPTVQQTFVCLHPLEKELVRALCFVLDELSYTVINSVYEFLEQGVYQEQPIERRGAFRVIYGVSEPILTPFPPPLDYVRALGYEIWLPLYTFVFDEGAPYGSGCAYSNFDVEHNGLDRPLGT